MTWLLWAVFTIIEIGFAAYEFGTSTTKKRWTKRRLLVSGTEAFIYLVMLLLPGIDFGFRFKGLAIILALRLLAAALFRLANRKNDSTKKRKWMVLGAIGSIVLLTCSMVPAFVLKDYQGRPLTGPYKTGECSAILTDRQRTETFETDGSFREVPVHIYYPAQIRSDAAADTAADPAKSSLPAAHTCPLVLFSHGAFGYYQSNASLYMELASHGYVVVSMDHPYHAFFTKDTAGKTIIVNREFLQTAMNINGSAGDEQTYAVTSVWMELREADMNFVLDTVKEAVQNGSPGEEWTAAGKDKTQLADILRMIDTDRIGLIGHSMGGATAVTVGRREDVSAAVDLDGTMLGEETGIKDGKLQFNETPYDTPLLCIDSESHHADREEAKKAGYLYVNNVIMEHASEGYSTYIEGSAHMNFTDLPLFAPPLAKMLGTGDVDPAVCIDTVNRVVRKFFDCYLKGTGEFRVEEHY